MGVVNQARSVSNTRKKRLDLLNRLVHSQATVAGFSLHFSQHKSNIFKISTQYNCDLQEFLLNSVKRKSYNTHKISARETPL